MSWKKPTQIVAWSFSRYSTYKQCPLKAKLKFIDKIDEPSNKAMERGSDIHNMAEHYIKGVLARIPKELKLFEKEMKALRKLYRERNKKGIIMAVEDTWAFTKEWDQTTWNDWANCCVRIKLDCAVEENEGHLIVTDWKTGRLRHEQSEDYNEQLELYALGAFLMFPDIHTVEPRLAYLDHGITYPELEGSMTYKRDDVPKLLKAWNNRVRPMLKDKKFAPRPNDKCHWCYYSAAKCRDRGVEPLCKY